MRLPVDLRIHSLTGGFFTIVIAAGLSGCATVDGSGNTEIADATSTASVSGTRVNGPQSDYPLVVGDPYQVGGITFTPVDTLNYDEVGYVSIDAGTMGYSAAHHTLPYPSYVEVTALDTGRTALLRVERRGPMTSQHILALSPAAMAQLGIDADAPVRVRRVNPPEEQRAMLRSGASAPLRMDTPQSLLSVLQRRLPESGTASLGAEEPSMAHAEDGRIETVEIAASSAAADPATPLAELDASESDTSVNLPDEVIEAAAVAEPASPEPAMDGRFVVQAASFANQDNARRAAAALGGEISQAGRFYRVRTGPFATRGEAEASLANVRRAGYTDARIQTSG